MYDIKKIYEPHTIDEAVKFLAEDEESIVINGGSDVLIKNREGHLSDLPFVSIYNIIFPPINARNLSSLDVSKSFTCLFFSISFFQFSDIYTPPYST